MFERLTSPFREFGAFAGLLYLIDRGLARLSSGHHLYYYEIMVQPIPAEPLVPERFRKTLEIREIRSGDPELDLMPARPGIIDSRFEQRAVCLGAFRKGALVGYLWFCYRAYEEDEVRCRFVVTPEDEAVFDFDLYVMPEHRLGLGFLAVWDGANRYLSGRGIRFSFSRVSRFNLASRRAHDHLGWKLIGRAVFLKLWRAECMVATRFPFVSISLRRKGRVQLRLRPDALLRVGSPTAGRATASAKGDDETRSD